MNNYSKSVKNIQDQTLNCKKVLNKIFHSIDCAFLKRYKYPSFVETTRWGNTEDKIYEIEFESFNKYDTNINIQISISGTDSTKLMDEISEVFND